MGKTLDWGILEGSVGPRVRLLRNALSARSIAASAPHGLPTGSLTVLALIAANPGSSQTALAGRAGLNKSALVGIVDQLERRGLVERVRVANDRRRYQVSVAPAGERAMNELFAELPDAIANTNVISSRLQFTLEDLGYEFPRYPLPPGGELSQRGLT